MDSLIVRLQEVELTQVSELDWFLFAADASLMTSGCCVVDQLLSQIEEHSVHYQLTMMVPVDAIAICSVSIPTRKPRQLAQALPFTLEELIPEEIECFHMALPSVLPSPETDLDVVIIEHRLLIGYLDILYHAQLSPQRIVVDALCLPRRSGCISVLAETTGVLLRRADNAGVCCAAELLGDLVSSYGIESSTVCELDVIIAKGGDDVEVLTTQQAIELNVEPRYCRYSESASELLAASLLRDPAPLNLLQGGYAVNSDKGDTLQRWRASLLSLAACVAVFVVVNFVAAFYFQYAASHSQQQSEALYRQLFPADRRVISPLKQMKSHLNASNASSQADFISLLVRTSEQISRLSSDSAISVQLLKFSDERGSIKFELVSETLEQLEQLKRALAGVGLTAEVSSAVERDGKVLSQIEVGGV